MVRLIPWRPLQPGHLIVNVTLTTLTKRRFAHCDRGGIYYYLDLYPRDPHTLIVQTECTAVQVHGTGHVKYTERSKGSLHAIGYSKRQ